MLKNMKRIPLLFIFKDGTEKEKSERNKINILKVKTVEEGGEG